MTKDKQSNMKVAIAKSRVYKGGVFQVLESIIEILNSKGITPDIVTLKSDVTPQISKENYSSLAKFRIRNILLNLKLPYEWHFLFYNYFSRNILDQYDLIIDSNNTSLFQNKHIPKIHYIHYPRKDRALTDKNSTHFPDGANKPFINLRQDIFNLTQILYRKDNSLDNKNVIIANSEFTKNAILKNYEYLSSDDIQVIYPPVVIPQFQSKKTKQKNLIITLGRISPEKRQLEQISIAKALPEFEFILIGFAKDLQYLNKCKTLIKELGLSNVSIKSNATWRGVSELLSKASYFLHNVRNEPFGITTVQGIAYGLIPIVHNSGGQKEIVQVKELRFNSQEEASEIINRIHNKDDSYKKEIKTFLNHEIKKYDKQSFKLQMKIILEQALIKLK